MNTARELLRDGLYAIIFQLAPRFANVILFIVLGRLAGVNEAGIFALAATYLLILTTIMRGLDDLVVRQVSRESSHAVKYLVNFAMLRIALALSLYALLVLIVIIGFNYTEGTTWAILIIGISLIPDSMAFVAQSVLLGQRKFGGSALIISAVSLIKLIAGVAIIVRGGTLAQIGWLWLLASSLGMIGLWILVLTSTARPKSTFRFDFSFLKNRWRTASIFFLITALATLETQMDTIILSGFRGETAVAWFGAATTVAYSLILLSQAYRFSVYPLMSRYAMKSGEKLTTLYKHSIQILATVIFPMVIGIILIAPQIVPFIFGDEFLPTIRVLQVLIIALIFVFLNEPNIRMMLVHDRQRWISIFLIISVTINISLNLILVPSRGAVGAAAARGSSAFILYLLTLLYVRRTITTVNLIINEK